MTWSRVNGDNVTHDGPEKGTWCQIGAKFNNVFEDGMCRCIVTALRLRVPYMVAITLEPLQTSLRKTSFLPPRVSSSLAHPPENGHFAGGRSSSSLDGMAMFWLDSH